MKATSELPTAAAAQRSDRRLRGFATMRERLGLYFLIAVLLPFGLGLAASELLIEQHLRALGAGLASAGIGAVRQRLETPGRTLVADVSVPTRTASLLEAARAAEPRAIARALREVGVPSEIDRLWLVLPDGRVFDREGSVADPGLQGAVERARRGQTVVSYEEVVLRSGRTLVAISAVGLGPAAPGGAMPVLVGGTSLAGQEARLLERGDTAVAVFHRGRVLAHGGADLSFGASSGEQPWDAAVYAGRSWSGPSRSAAKDAFVSAQPLVDAAGIVVGALAYQVATSELAILRADSRQSFMLALGAGAALALALSLAVARQVTAPLRRLARAAVAMERGEATGPIHLGRRDEVGTLEAILGRASNRLSESRSALEARVQERTRELEQARDREAALNRDLVAQNAQLQAQSELLRAQGEELERQRLDLIEKTRRSDEADRLKNAFIANMSHEIRTPLNSILALSELLRDGMAGPLAVDQRRYLEVIERNGQSLLRLISDILDLSRIEAGRLELDVHPLQLAPVIHSVTTALFPLAESKGLDVSVRIPDDLPLVRCDADRVQQVLTNLVGNAIKFTERGQIFVSAEARGDTVAVHVADTGIGIPEADRERIFQEFFQVDQTLARRQGGTGLGLAIASRLATAMGGRIDVQSAVGVGSRFTLTLSQARAGVELPAAAAPVDVQAFGPLEGHALVVSADEASAADVRALLEGTGLRVTVARRIEGAALDPASPVDVVVLLGVPATGTDGVAALRRHPHLARAPVVVAAEHDVSAAERERVAAEAFAFVPPGDVRRIGLLSAIAKAVSAGPAAPQPATPPPRDASVLVVEDNDDNLFTIRQILARLSIEIVAAASGREAIEFCRRRRPDLIIMDMQMPGISGLQAAGAIRSLPGGAAIPIVALTAQAMKGDRERILAAGCDEYLSKPIHPKHLLGLVQRLLGRDVGGLEVGAAPTRGRAHGTHTSG